MIKNEKQYNITNKKLVGLKEQIERIKSLGEPLPAAKRLILASTLLMKAQLEKEIDDYIYLKDYEDVVLGERDITRLPSLITEYKIASGMTQKEFAKKTGMKEQQIQRYEAEDFSSISFSNLLKLLKAIGLDIMIKDIPVQKITGKY